MTDYFGSNVSGDGGAAGDDVDDYDESRSLGIVCKKSGYDDTVALVEMMVTIASLSVVDRKVKRIFLMMLPLTIHTTRQVANQGKTWEKS
jgi:hypothetical protein